MDKEVLSKSIDGVYRVLIARENRLQSLWQHRFKYVYKSKQRAFRFYKKAVKLIRDIKKLRRIIFDLTYILSYK